MLNHWSIRSRPTFGTLYLLAALAAHPAFSQPPVRPSADAIVAELRELFAQGDVERIARMADTLAPRYPFSPEIAAWGIRARAVAPSLFLFDFGQSAAILRDAQALSKRFPSSPDAALALATALKRFDADPVTNRPSDARALRAVDDALRKHPSHTGLLVLKSQILIDAGRPAAAKPLLTSAVQRAPRDPGLRLMLGLADLAVAPGDTAATARAQAEFRAAISADSSFGPAYAALARTYRSARRRAEAESLFAMAARRRPVGYALQMEHVRSVLARADWDTERKHQAVRDKIAVLLSEHSDHAGMIRWASAAYDAIGDTAQSHAMDAELLRRFPDSDEAWQALRDRDSTLFMMWDSVAVAAFSPALRQMIHQANEPRIAVAHRVLADSSSGPGARNAVRALLLAIGTLDTTSLSDSEFTALARAADAAGGGRIDGRLAQNLAVRLMRTDRRLAKSIAQRVDSTGREMVSWCKASFPSTGEFVASMNGSIASAAANLGALFALEGDTRRADSAFRKALVFAPKNHDAHLGLGQLHEQRHDLQAAKDEYALAAMDENWDESGREGQHALVRLGVAPSMAEVMDVIRDQFKARVIADTVRFTRMLPAFRLADASGKMVSSDMLKGKVVVINAWGTWCGPCVGEAPAIEAFYKKFKGDSTVALVTVAFGDSPEAVRSFMTSHRLTYPVLLDDGLWVEKRLKVRAYPTTYVVDRSGRILYVPTSRTSLVDEWTWMVEDAIRRPR
jgi:peroxiredoxin/tetratricopeptide (TPR) repeat protein